MGCQCGSFEVVAEVLKVTKRGSALSNAIQENKAVVIAFFEAMNGHDIDDLDLIVAGDVVRHCPATPDVTVTSLAQFKEFMRSDITAFPDSCQTPVLMVGEGELVAVWATYEEIGRAHV